MSRSLFFLWSRSFHLPYERVPCFQRDNYQFRTRRSNSWRKFCAWNGCSELLESDTLLLEPRGCCATTLLCLYFKSARPQKTRWNSTHYVGVKSVGTVTLLGSMEHPAVNRWSSTSNSESRGLDPGRDDRSWMPTNWENTLIFVNAINLPNSDVLFSPSRMPLRFSRRSVLRRHSEAEKCLSEPFEDDVTLVCVKKTRG